MLYVIAYDIPDDGRRAKVADALKDYGVRVQFSVFEAILDASLARELGERLRGLIDDAEDSVRVYAACADCVPRLAILGQGNRTEVPDLIVL